MFEEGTQTCFESLDLTTEGIEKLKLLRFVGVTKMEDLGVVGILGLDNFERQIERCEAEVLKELDLNQ